MIKVMGETTQEQIQSIDNIFVSMMRHNDDVKRKVPIKYIVPFFCGTVESPRETIFLYAPNYAQTIKDMRLYIADCHNDGVTLECVIVGEQTRNTSQRIKKGDNHITLSLCMTDEDVLYINIITNSEQQYPVGLAGTIEGVHICI